MISTRITKEARSPLGKRRILDVLQTAPEGLTTIEIAVGLDANRHDVGGRLSKLAACGEIEKLKDLLPSGKAKWRLNQQRK